MNSSQKNEQKADDFSNWKEKYQVLRHALKKKTISTTTTKKSSCKSLQELFYFFQCMNLIIYASWRLE